MPEFIIAHDDQDPTVREPKLVKPHRRLLRSVVPLGALAALVSCSSSEQASKPPVAKTTSPAAAKSIEQSPTPRITPSQLEESTSPTPTTSSLPARERPPQAPQPAPVYRPPAGSTAPLFTPPGQPTIKQFPQECHALTDAGYRAQCVVVTGALGEQAIGIVEDRVISKGKEDERDLVYRRSGNEAILALRSVMTVGYYGGGRSVAVKDVNGDHDPKLTFVDYDPSYTDNPQRTLISVDVVEATGQLTLHVPLNNGEARLASGGGLETFSRAGNDQDLHQIIRYEDGAWRLPVSGLIPVSAMPPFGNSSDYF